MAGQITIESTTDSVDDVRAALGLPAAPPPAADTAADPPKQEAKPKADPPADPAAVDSAGEDDTDDGDGDDDAAASQAGSELADRRWKAKKRIDALTKQKGQLERERNALKAELDRLRASQATTPPATTAPPPADAPPAAPTADAAPATPPATERPKPKEDDFETYSEYTEAMIEWVAEQRASALRAEIETIKREREAERAAAAKAQEEARRREEFERAKLDYEVRHKAVTSRHPDFDAVMKEHEDTQTSPEVVRFIQTDPNGLDMAYYLAQNLEELNAILARPGAEQSGALARLAGKLEATGYFADGMPASQTPPAADSGGTRRVAVSKAPPPPPILDGGRTVVAVDPEKMSHSEFKKWREQGSRR